MREHIKLVHSHRMKLLPKQISSLITPVGGAQDCRQIRNAENNVHLPGPSLLSGRHFPAYKLAKSWNDLPQSLKSAALYDFETSFADHMANINDKVCGKANCSICDFGHR